MNQSCFHPISAKLVNQLGYPDAFTYPFNYVPHPLARYAAEEVQAELRGQPNLFQPITKESPTTGMASGKMFGVLIVKNRAGNFGYLKAFSGDLAGQHQLPGFVPPIFDRLAPDGFFRRGEAILDQLNAKISQLETEGPLPAARTTLREIQQEAEQEIKAQKAQLKANKKQRRLLRALANEQLESAKSAQHNAALDQKSLQEKNEFRRLKKAWQSRITAVLEQVRRLEMPITLLKEQRQNLSASLQQQLFDQYNFLNIKGQVKNVRPIFTRVLDGTPPAGAGDCALPKLLQYAFQKQWTPVCMAEFWWGPNPAGQIRKQGQYYPACRSKCEPILTHMLEGLSVAPNPLISKLKRAKPLSIIYEDDHLLAIDKPAGFLSVPGKTMIDSVYQRLKLRYPAATGPLLVHRLDMATSGLLLIAKRTEVHRALQAQFIKRRVQKRYVALLDGELGMDKGSIQLPLRVDLDNRPQQMICHIHGKKALTRWQVLGRDQGRTRVHFFPVTGRTHQLRVHAAHPDGLNIPILGDELYGCPGNRLYLHAEALTFWHPVKKEQMTVEAQSSF